MRFCACFTAMRRIILAGFRATCARVCVRGLVSEETKMKLVKISMVIMAMCMFGLAQTTTADKKPAAKSAHVNAAPAGEGMATPAPEILKVLRTVGTWSAIVKNEP